MRTDCVLDWMHKHHIPLTRKNYLNTAYLGDPPVDEHGNLDAELEAELPEMFQRADLFIDGEEQP
jgi:hypothetical protein